MTEQANPQKIAVLGGGIASLTAVYELTSNPNWQEQYEITVYQLGWRLGGKLAGGRNPEVAERIEETTLIHALYGYYQYTFNLIENIYREIPNLTDPLWAEFPFSTWEDAFETRNNFVMWDFVVDEWQPWSLTLPTRSGNPGDIIDFPPPIQYLVHLINAMYNNLDKLVEVTPETDPKAIKILEELIIISEEIWVMAQDLDIEDKIRLALIVRKYKEYISYLDELLATVGLDVRRVVIILWLGASNAIGIIESGVLFNGFLSINDQDYQTWLSQYDAPNFILNSAPVRTLYDLFEAYPDGKTAVAPEIGGNFAAGTTLLLAMNMALGYRGAPLYLPKTCMSEVVIAPMYAILAQRGVKFDFFHKVLRLEPSQDGTAIGEIVIERQALLHEYLHTYYPLREVKKLPVWPIEPFYDQLRDGAKLQKGKFNFESYWTNWRGYPPHRHLKQGEDFDQIILGISIGALPEIVKPLLDEATNPNSYTAWQNMLEHVLTLQTQGVKLWFNETLAELGWLLPPTAAGAYATPLNAALDSSYSAEWEDWPENNQPQTVTAYLGPLAKLIEPAPPEPKYPILQTKKAGRVGLEWLEKYVASYYPHFVTGARLRYGKLSDLNDGRGMARYEAQYWAANINPSDRGVLSVAGSDVYRMKADGSGFTNLFLTGDWVDNGQLNVGYVEAAVLAGTQAATAIVTQTNSSATGEAEPTSEV